MAEMSDYCKAYLAKDLRKFDGWKEDTSNLRTETEEVDGQEQEVQREEIGDEDILYVHDSYIVTDDVPPGALAIARSRQVTKPGWVAARDDAAGR